MPQSFSANAGERLNQGFPNKSHVHSAVAWQPSPSSSPSPRSWTECHRLSTAFMRARKLVIGELRRRNVHLLLGVVQRVPSTPHLPNSKWRTWLVGEVSEEDAEGLEGDVPFPVGDDVVGDLAHVESYARPETGCLAEFATDRTVAGYQRNPPWAVGTRSAFIPSAMAVHVRPAARAR